MNRNISLSKHLIAALLIAPQLHAATYYTSTTVNLENDFTELPSGGNIYFRAAVNHVLDSTFYAQAGDTVTLTVNFANSQSLRLYSASDWEGGTVNISAFMAGSQSHSATGTMTFLGASGDLIQSSFAGSTSGLGNTVYAPGVTTYNVNFTDTYFEFSGIQTVINITSLLNQSNQQVSANFTGAWMQFKGGSFEIIPEPSAAFLLGLGALGLAARRQRQTQGIALRAGRAIPE